MENCKKQRDVVKMNVIKSCGNRTACWPTIKVSSTCIGVPPITRPINTSEISIIPTVKRYFYVAMANINLANGATLPATLFYNDDGSSTIEFMSFSPNGYADLFINAVIQEGGMYSVDTNSLTISPANATIYRGTPIILELLTFSAERSL